MGSAEVKVCPSTLRLVQIIYSRQLRNRLIAASIFVSQIFSVSGNQFIIVWNDVALRAVRYGNVPPPIAVRQMAMVHVGIHDALAGATREGNLLWATNAPGGECSEVASVTESGYRMLRTFFPASSELLDLHHRAMLAALPNNAAKTNGIVWGRSVATQILRSRQFDGSGTAVAWVTNNVPGYWRRTPHLYEKPLLPNWGNVQPLAIDSAGTFRAEPAPSLTSAEWARQFNEVKWLGSTNSTARSSQQREIALFWADGPKTETPPGHWNRIAQQVAEKKGYDLIESARLFALLNIAMADAAIVCWNNKYNYNWWRPITAIREGDKDGNPETEPDPSWTPLIPTPPFPEHTSGHSTFSAAAATILAEFTGSDEFQFVTSSDGLPGIARNFRRFSDAAKEAGLSRIYGGIHFAAANEEGQRTGREVALKVMEKLGARTKVDVAP